MTDTDILSDARSVVYRGTKPHFSRDAFEAEAERLCDRDVRKFSKALAEKGSDVEVLVAASRVADLADYSKGRPEAHGSAREAAWEVIAEGARKAFPGVSFAKAVSEFLRTPSGAAAYARHRAVFFDP